MFLLYDLFIFFYAGTVHLAAIWGNQKAKAWVNGRKDWRLKLNSAMKNAGELRIWIHCASLGEFEQGRPLIEKLRDNYKDAFIILTFFSPSGFEVRKNYDRVNLVQYLPADTKSNAKDFINAVKPTLAIFIKYEYWFHYFSELNKKKVPLFIVSAIFRRSQIFFRWYGYFFRKILMNVTRFFVQDPVSEILLSEKGFKNVTITGDTRFDRVKYLSQHLIQNNLVEKFKSDSFLIVAGSTWEKDEDILLETFSIFKDKKPKLIIAPHEVDADRISSLKTKLLEYYSENEIAFYSLKNISEESNILVVDAVGILSSIYRYGNIAWIGGGFGKGIHNILEAAAYGVPVIFGPAYHKFREATELIKNQGAISVNSKEESVNTFKMFMENPEVLKTYGQNSAAFVIENAGATEKILSSIKIQRL